MKRLFLGMMLLILLIVVPFESYTRSVGPLGDYPHDPRGEITDNVIDWPTCYQGETQEIYVELRNPSATTYHYLVVVNIYDSNNAVVYDSHLVGEDKDGFVSGAQTVAWGPWFYTLPHDAVTGTWHVLAGLRMYPWDPELDYRGLSWCEPEETFNVKPSHETIEGREVVSNDYDGDGYADSVSIRVLAKTNALEEVDVEAYGDLKDPYDTVVDTESSGMWTVPAGGQSLGYPFYLFVPGGSPVGWYSIDLQLYDATHHNDYPDPEDVAPNAGSAYLYPLGYGWNRRLTVSSAHDSPVPSNGDHYYTSGTSVTCSVTSPVIEGDTEWTCTGWSGTGSVPSSGGGTSVTFTITQTSSITWNWIVTPTVPHTLTVSSAHDSPNPSNGQHTYNDGSSVTCSVTSPVVEGGVSHSCTGWSGTGSVPSSGSGTSVTFAITQDSAITWNWQLDVSPILQHKDTSMLCLDGCDLKEVSTNHAWNESHGSVGCNHESNYCLPASISMMNSYYGGQLSQDRISHYIWQERGQDGDSDPEGDLGHGKRVLTGEVIYALAWSLGVSISSIDYLNFKPSFAQIQAWLDSGRLILRRNVAGDWHATVINGYEEAGQFLRFIDPESGEGREPYDSLVIQSVWVPPAVNAPKPDEPSIHADSDNDGVVDFDEIFRFHTNPNKADTDSDLVLDREEIRSYTFLNNGAWDATNIRKPDIDNDGRAELDNDSDGGGTPDGLEDKDHDGIVDPGETDPLNPYDDQLRAASLQILAHSPINLLVTDPFGRRVGYDPATHSVVNEIPYAIYSGPGSEPQNITIQNSLNGTYKVAAVGTDNGPYVISVESLDINGSVIDNDIWEGVSVLGEQYNEILRLDPDGILVLPHDIEIASIEPSKSAIGQNYTVSVNVTVRNRGNYTETFDLTLYSNNTILAILSNISLYSGDSVVATFLWNTAGSSYGSYIMKTFAQPVPGEKDTTDNTLSGIAVMISIPGDVIGPAGIPGDADRMVDLRDVYAVGRAFGQVPGDLRYNPNFDINGDGKIDLKDYFITCKNYGKSW